MQIFENIRPRTFRAILCFFEETNIEQLVNFLKNIMDFKGTDCGFFENISKLKKYIF